MIYQPAFSLLGLLLVAVLAGVSGAQQFLFFVGGALAGAGLVLAVVNDRRIALD